MELTVYTPSPVGGPGRRAVSGVSVEPLKSSPIPCSLLPTTGTWIPSCFPYLNCWRHYVELRLKYLIGRCQRLLDQPSEPKHGHRLDTLWADLGGLLDVAYPHEEPLDRRVVDRLLTQCAAQDAERACVYGDNAYGTGPFTFADTGQGFQDFSLPVGYHQRRRCPTHASQHNEL